MVLQDTHLFTASVKDNIRYGKLDATDEEVIEAAKLANADSFIERLPQGYDTVLTGDGANLSQGQRQLLSIARAAIADPPVLILDEATSSIDTRTEKIVQEGMDRLMHGRTTFVIAHRLSTIKNSDCIMVLEQGRIIERGSHDDLIEEQGRYYQLYTGNKAQLIQHLFLYHIIKHLYRVLHPRCIEIGIVYDEGMCRKIIWAVVIVGGEAVQFDTFL